MTAAEAVFGSKEVEWKRRKVRSAEKD